MTGTSRPQERHSPQTLGDKPPPRLSVQKDDEFSGHLPLLPLDCHLFPPSPFLFPLIFFSTLKTSNFALGMSRMKCHLPIKRETEEKAMHHITYKFFEIKASFWLWNCNNEWILSFHPTFLYLMKREILQEAHPQGPSSPSWFSFCFVAACCPSPPPSPPTACSLSSLRKGQEGTGEMQTLYTRGGLQAWALKLWGVWSLFSLKQGLGDLGSKLIIAYSGGRSQSPQGDSPSAALGPFQMAQVLRLSPLSPSPGSPSLLLVGMNSCKVSIPCFVTQHPWCHLSTTRSSDLLLQNLLTASVNGLGHFLSPLLQSGIQFGPCLF